MEELKQKILDWLEPKLQQEGLFPVDVLIGTNFRIQVFLDAIPSISISQCVTISRFLEAYLDQDPSVPENYNLEVSSPGMTNPLKVPMQYKKAVGRTLKVTTIEGESFAVKVLDADDDKVQVVKTTIEEKGIKNKPRKASAKDSEEEPFELPYEQIKQAKLHFNI
jgi:ribosome maturation factor RimP